MNNLILPVYFLIDLSHPDGMHNANLNNVVNNCINELRHIATTSTECSNIMLNIYGYSTGIRNLTNGFVNANDFEFENLNTGGLVDLGAAIKELDSNLSAENLSKLGTCTNPIIVFIMHSEPTDAYDKALLNMQNNEFFNLSEKIVVSLERDEYAASAIKDFLGEEYVIAPDDFFDRINQIIIGNHNEQYKETTFSSKQELTVGNIVKTYHGVDLKIEKLIGEGGNSKVFLVDFQGEKRALKVYDCTDQSSKYILKNLSTIENPDTSFLWVYDLLEAESGKIGYIMDLIPEDYYECRKILFYSNSEKIKSLNSYKNCIMSVINIMRAFRKLHQMGYCCQELNDGDFFINPKNGEVLINIVEKISVSGKTSRVMYKPRYRAPELVVNDRACPDAWTDRFSLAIIAFMILCKAHPLEGKKWCVPCLTDEMAKELYGSNPVFIFDKDNDSNRPVKGIHDYLLYIWDLLPKYIRAAFCHTFSKEALHNPQKRLSESDWLEILTRLYDDTIKCECGNFVFYNQDDRTICENCKETISVEYVLSGEEFDIPIVKDYHVLNTKATWTDNYNKILFKVVTKEDSDNLYLVNVSGKMIKCLTPSGRVKEVKNNLLIPVIDGVKVIIADKEWQIKKLGVTKYE